jgi:hypothetical protein
MYNAGVRSVCIRHRSPLDRSRYHSKLQPTLQQYTIRLRKQAAARQDAEYAPTCTLYNTTGVVGEHVG